MSVAKRRNDADDSLSSSAMSLVDSGCRAIDEASRLPVGQQLVVGGASGWVVGFLSMKAGRWLLWTAGGGILALQFLHHQGYVRVNWEEINKKVTDLKGRVTGEDPSSSTFANNNLGPSFFEKVTAFAERHTALAGGFVAGALLGLGSG